MFLESLHHFVISAQGEKVAVSGLGWDHLLLMIPLLRTVGGASQG